MGSFFATREESGIQVMRVISLYGQRNAVRIALKKQINNLDRTVDERKAIYADLRAKEQLLTEQIAQSLIALPEDDASLLMDLYEQNTK